MIYIKCFENCLPLRIAQKVQYSWCLICTFFSYFHFTVSCRFYFNTIWQWGSFYIKSSRRKVKLWKYYQTFLATYLECLSGWIYFSQYYFGFLLLYVQKVCTLTHSPCQMIPYNVVITECFWRKLLKLNQIYLHSL